VCVCVCVCFMRQVKTSSACETMGSATTICSDKTGTLTTSKMTVMNCWTAGEVMQPSSVASKVDGSLKKVIQDAMTINTSEKTDLVALEDKAGKVVKVDGKVQMKYSGNMTECAMLKFVNELDAFKGDPGDPSMPYKAIRNSFPESMPGRAVITFSSKRKRMSTMVPMPPGTQSPHRIYCKGASEMVLELCTKVAQKDGSDGALTANTKQQIQEAIDSFANEGLRTIAVAYKDLNESPVGPDGTLPEETESDLTLLCIVGIEDPLRDEVKGAIEICRKAGIVVRMVTGDNISTAKAISKKAQILTQEGLDSGEEIAMTGEQFRLAVLTEQNKEDPERWINQDEFDKIWPKLRVLARSTPTDKLVLVTGIQKSRIPFTVVKEDTGEKYTYTRQVIPHPAPELDQTPVPSCARCRL
jgi:Ca2+ transporting ATPase